MTTPLSNFRDIVQLLFKVVREDAYENENVQRLISKIHDVLAGATHFSAQPKIEPIHLPFELFRPPTPPTLVIHPDQEMGEIVPNVVVTKEEPAEVRNLVVNMPTVVHAVKMGVAPNTTPVVSALSGPPSDSAILQDLARDIAESEHEVEAEDDDVEEDAVSEAGTEVEEEEEEVEEEEAEEEAEEEEAEEEAEEEEAEEEEAEEEAEEEDDDLELLKIKKQRYYWSPSSTRIYEHLEEGYGDCIGTYVDGKIIPKA